MQKTNIIAALNLQRPDILERYPLRIRTTISGVVKYYPTGLMLTKEQWKDGVVIGHPHRASYNTIIRKKIFDVEKQILEFAITGDDVIKRKQKNDMLFETYAKKVILKMTNVHAGSTIKHKNSYLKKFLDFKPKIKIKDITSEVLENYETYCFSIGNMPNTVWGSSKFVKTILNAATGKGKIFETPPHEGFVGVKYSDKLPTSLTKAEVESFEEFAANPLNNSTLLNVANWFIFSCYSGLRYGDLRDFESFINEKVLLQTNKTKAIVSIFATDKIIEAKARLNNKIFSNQKCNEYLKLISAGCKINKKITMHVARHTFAVQFLERGGRLEVLSKIMGHKLLKTTQIYGRISTKLQDEEMKKVWNVIEPVKEPVKEDDTPF